MGRRNSVKYYTEALYTSYNSRGSMYRDGTLCDSSGDRRNTPFSSSSGNLVEQLSRIQSCEYGFSINRTDVNQFGNLGRIGASVVDPPEVYLNFNYLLADAHNEMLLDMAINGESQAFYQYLNSPDRPPDKTTQSKNYFILVGPPNDDLNNSNIALNSGDMSVISMGDGFISEYQVTAAVGEIATASVTVQGSNVQSNVGFANILHPGLTACGTRNCDYCFSLPDPVSHPTYSKLNPDTCCEETVTGITALLPGDICLSMSNHSLISKQSTATGLCTLSGSCLDEGAAHIQGFQINANLSREPLRRLGQTFDYAKELATPSTITLDVEAIVSDIKTANLQTYLCEGYRDITIALYPPCGGFSCPNPSPQPNMTYTFKQAVLESESFSSAIGDNKTVALSFSVQLGSKSSTDAGFFISGRSFQPEFLGRQAQGGVCTSWILQQLGLCFLIAAERSRGS